MLSALLAGLLAVSACRRDPSSTPPPAETRPNIILLSIESLRADHVGCYGYTRETSPQIDALAKQATCYEQAYAATSWTLTSHASMFTGLYPSAHRVILPQDRLGDAYTTAAEHLSAAGYQCAGVISGPYLRSTFNLNQGFEYYDESAASATNEAAHQDVTNPQMAAALEQFLRNERDPQRPFFLFAYYWDTHYDFIPPQPYDTLFVPPEAEPVESVRFGPVVALGRDISQAQLAYLVAQYDGEIRCTDEYLGRLWKLLRELDLWDNTAIILTADHGEQFFEHSYLGHKHDLYVESLHVPLLVKRAGQSAPQRARRVVNLIDLYPTLLGLARCEVSTPHNGRSLLRDDPGDERAVFHELTTTWDITNRETGETKHERDQWVAVRQGRYKLLHVLGTRFWQIYDVLADPREQNPLGAECRDAGVRLEQSLGAWQQAMGSMSTLWEQGPKAQLSPEEVQRLRALGYLP
ncbi:MAG: sulfatase [Planctomycetes bacterium]|nr:sulfatase [Planctomycetota bacterium]